MRNPLLYASRATLIAALAAAGLAAGVPAMAQDGAAAASAGDPSEALRDPSSDPDEDVIIVQGGRPEGVTRSEVQRQARDIAVRQGSVYKEPLARFEDSLCPGVIGLVAEHASYIIDRIRDDADDLGIKLQDDGCEANLIVMFTPDSRATMQAMMDEQPWLFQHHDAGEKRDMLEPGPARVWTWTQPFTRDGIPISYSDDGQPAVLSTWSAHSRIYTAVRNDITSAIVMFDMDAVRGKSLNQLADYAIMRGLAQTRPTDDPTMDSILTLFDDPAPPERLTRFDRAYLRALYEWIPNLPAITKITQVNRQLRLLDEEMDRREAESQQ